MYCTKLVPVVLYHTNLAGKHQLGSVLTGSLLRKEVRRQNNNSKSSFLYSFRLWTRDFRAYVSALNGVLFFIS